MVQRGLLWLELAAILVALVVLEAGAILLELRTSIILDWFVALVPLVWLNLSILFVYGFLRQLYSYHPEARRGGPRTLVGDLFRVRFDAVRPALSRRGIRPLWAATGTVYALVYMYLQGMLFVDPEGHINPLFSILESPIGYGPALVWAPATTFGFLLRPYTLAAAVALSLFSGLVLALFVSLLAARREAVRALPGPLAGLGVMCPTCAATPMTGLLLAYLAPTVSLVGFGSASIFSLALGVSTLLLFAAFILLWATVAWLSRLHGSTRPATRQRAYS